MKKSSRKKCRLRTVNDLVNEQRSSLRGRVTSTEILLYNSDRTRFLKARRGTDPIVDKGTFWAIEMGDVEVAFTKDGRGIRHYEFHFKIDWRSLSFPKPRVEREPEVFVFAARNGYEAA